MKQIKILIALTVLTLFTACSSNNWVPKPAGYPRIVFPEKGYQEYSAECPFSFKYPKYAEVVKDTSAGAGSCFLDMKFPQFNATVHLTYKSVSSYKSFYEMSEDARTFAYKHTVKADEIQDSVFRIKNSHVSGVYYNIEGNAASSIQFYATDSAKHYVRGALYFNTHPNKDSLAPVVHFIHQDIDTMLRSLKWR